MKTGNSYDLTIIKKCHWSELLNVFGLTKSDNSDLDEDAKTLSDFLWKNITNDHSPSIAEVLRVFLTTLASKTTSYEDSIYLAIAKCDDAFTVIKWFVQNLRTFYC